LGCLALFGFIILGLREGIIPASKVPWLVNMFEKVGMGGLIGKPDGVVKHVKSAPKASGWQQYMKEHPDYARKYAAWYQYAKKHPGYAKQYRQQYANYYNRRYRR